MGHRPRRRLLLCHPLWLYPCCLTLCHTPPVRLRLPWGVSRLIVNGWYKGTGRMCVTVRAQGAGGCRASGHLHTSTSSGHLYRRGPRVRAPAWCVDRGQGTAENRDTGGGFKESKWMRLLSHAYGTSNKTSLLATSPVPPRAASYNFPPPPPPPTFLLPLLLLLLLLALGRDKLLPIHLHIRLVPCAQADCESACRT